jgi:hypothetical protein
MFRERTVVILGAGASWHYGFPTGEELVSAAAEFASHASRYLELVGNNIQSNLVEKMVPKSIIDEYKVPLNDVENAKRALTIEGLKYDNLRGSLNQIRPLVIDYFLGWNKTLQSVGKTSIAGALLRAELNWIKENHYNPNRRSLYYKSPDPSIQSKGVEVQLDKFKDDWHRFIVHKIVFGCESSKDIFRNNIYFVTFNYDTSLEHVLYTSLSSIELFEEDDVINFITNRVRHVYGQTRSEFRSLANTKLDKALSRLGDQSYHDDYRQFAEWKAVLEEVHRLSAGIRTIDDVDKEIDSDGLTTISNLVVEARNLYIFGYGFDMKNNHRIGLRELGTKLDMQPFRRIMFTNYSDIPAVNKRFSSTFALDPNVVAKQSSFNGRGSHSLFEKSTKDVYEALAGDFFLESEEFLNQ